MNLVKYLSLSKFLHLLLGKIHLNIKKFISFHSLSFQIFFLTILSNLFLIKIISVQNYRQNLQF